MTYENIKTVLLTFLIIVSGVLTWSIWTFQASYELMEGEQTITEVVIGEKKEVKQLIKPSQVIYHRNGRTYGTIESAEIDEIISMIGTWKYYDVKKYSSDPQRLDSELAKGRFTEIIFPHEVPVDIYNKVLAFEEDLPRFEFDRIFIDSDFSGRQEGNVYFYSTKYQDTFIASVALSSIQGFSQMFQQTDSKHIPVKSYELPAGKKIYLPTQGIEMKSYAYYRNPVETEELKNALFRDPSFVQRSILSDMEEYANEVSKMTVNKNTNLISYINPFRDGDPSSRPENLIQRSIEFVNAHSGWTDDYRYVYKDDLNQRVVFRMYTDEGYPIFNQIGMSEISQEWGQSGIRRYTRPSFSLELPLNPETNSHEFPSGEEVYQLLMEKEDLDPERIGDIKLGYYMLNNPNDSYLIFLEPGWFYQYDHVWFELMLEEEAESHGLE